MDTQKWFRVDKESGRIVSAADFKVKAMAESCYRSPAEVIATGRFNTTFAVYVRADQLTDSERSEIKDFAAL